MGAGTGVSVGVGAGTRVGVGPGVAVGLGVGRAVGVGLGVAVKVGDGREVGVGLGTAVGRGTTVGNAAMVDSTLASTVALISTVVWGVESGIVFRATACTVASMAGVGFSWQASPAETPTRASITTMSLNMDLPAEPADVCGGLNRESLL